MKDFEKYFKIDEFHTSSPKKRKTNMKFHKLNQFVLNNSGKSFNKGLFKFHNIEQIDSWQEIIARFFPEAKDKIMPFAYDWLGRNFAINLLNSDLILSFDPGTGEITKIPVSLDIFIEKELIEHSEELLLHKVHDRWIEEGGQIPNVYECIGFKQPLFVGGNDNFDNYELTDMDVYWNISGQLYNKTKDLPEGSSISIVKG